MADLRHLKRRHQAWYFRLRVPADLRAQVGKAEIVETLQTQDLKLAQQLRWKRLADWNQEFAVMRGEREAAQPAARDIYYETRENMTFAIQHLPLDEQIEQLELAQSVFVDQLERVARGPVRYETTPPEKKAEFDAYCDILNELEGKKVAIRDVYREPLSLTAKRFLTAKADRLTNQTKAQHQAVYRLLVDFTDDKPLQLITRKEAVAFIDEVATLDPSWGRSPETKQRSLTELKLLYGNKGRGLSDSTINRYLSALISLWKWAKGRDDVSGECPFEGQMRRVGRKNSKPYFPMELDDLDRLFAQPMPKNAALWEIPLVGLYSGMRLNEICSLEWENVRREDGIWYFDIVASKSDAGVRVVPIHSRLMWLLRRRPESQSGQLWPSLKPGGPDGKFSWYFSKAFTTFRRSRGIDDSGDRRAFHSLRKNVVRCLERARVQQTEAAEIIGHEKSGITYRVYNPNGMTMPQRRDIVELIDYPGLVLPASFSADRSAESGWSETESRTVS